MSAVVVNGSQRAAHDLVTDRAKETELLRSLETVGHLI